MQVKISSNSCQLFFRSSKREKRLGRRKWNDSFPHISSFQPIFTAPEFTECGIVGQRRIINGPSFFNSFHIGGRVKMFLKPFKLWSSERVLQKELFEFDSPFSRKNVRYRRKKISVIFCTCSIYLLTISMQYIFLIQYFLCRYANFVFEIVQVFRFWWLISVHHRALSRR